MCAYNSINGQPACANEFLLDDQLRGKWEFQGYVVSDCGAVRDIFNGHHYEPSVAQAAADQPDARHGQRVHRFPRQGDGRPRLQAVSSTR